MGWHLDPRGRVLPDWMVRMRASPFFCLSMHCRYPVFVQVPRPPVFFGDDPELSPISEPIPGVTVWCGPEATLPESVSIPPPVQVITAIPAFTANELQFSEHRDRVRARLTEDLLISIPGLRAAWLYEVQAPLGEVYATLIWKVWYHA